MARQLHGLTLRELAERCDLTPGAVSQFEKEHTPPSAATVRKLALALGLPPQFFAVGSRTVAGGPSGTHFRSLRATTSKERSAAWAWSQIVLDVAAALQAYVEFPPVDIPAVPLAPDAPRGAVAAAAAAVRSGWSLPDGPIGNVLREVEAHGAVAAWSRSTSERISAFSSWQGDRPVMILGATKGDAARSRFDAAHELGHLVCHPKADPTGAHEAQAQAFAAELLMPAEEIIDELPRRFDLGAYAHLKHRWGVSIQALLYRARTLEVISDSAYQRAMMHISQTYGRRNEPYPITDTERPQLLGKAYQLAAADGVRAEDLAEAAGLPAQTVHEVLDDQPTQPRVVL
jgi:Zn-dependent peptidase ImmA (M78 family)/transcriptional regulator with XRE-family HTH domain